MEWCKKLAGRLGISRFVDDLAGYQDTLAAVNALEADFGAASDEKLGALAQHLRGRVRAGASLSDASVQVFALVREVASRTIGLRPFDVQVLGGLALCESKIVQMHTGEGKTLAAVAPVALNALQGKGVHVLTFNDYLARRDAGWMEPIYQFLGLRVGSVQEGMPPKARRAAYEADVTYVTAKESGFDYLRDALAVEPDLLVHRPFNMALVDEADSILIDEARIPLVIAGNTLEQPGQPERLAAIVQQLVLERHYVVDHKGRAVHLTDDGLDRAEALLGCGTLHTMQNLTLLTELHTALYAAAFMQRDVDYIVRRGRVEVVDEFTGRVVEDRHWPDGLQAAIEAKEGLGRSPEGKVLGQITLQHFLEQYPHLCGMTATAQAAADELLLVYGCQVVVVPPNQACIRVDHPDVVFIHKEAKQRAIVEEVVKVHKTGRPILVGTLTVQESEQLATRLHQASISGRVLNAKRDAQEARIVAQAGKPGAVTISTNMAGRGTDIRLGGVDGVEKEQVVALGGLYVLGTNRHESQRVDDQLRGRAGRQGDPGSSCFFISLEDDLLQHNGIDDLVPAHYKPAQQREAMDNPLIRQQIAHVQRIVQGRNFDIRQVLWSYSRIVELQRRIVSQERRRILMGDERLDTLRKRVPALYERICGLIGSEAAAELETRLTLYVIDQCWAEHLAVVAEIRDSIHLVIIGGLAPLEEFQKSVAQSFECIRQSIEERIVERFAVLRVTANGIDLDAEGLRGPASTWTYLVQDDILNDPISAALFSQRNIGFAASVAFSAPLLMLWMLLQRFQKRRDPTEKP